MKSNTDLSVTLSAKIQAFMSAMDDAAGKVEKVGKKMQGVGKNLSAFVTAPILGAGAVALNSAVKFEKLETSLGILTGSAEEGAKAFERLRDYSASTPFQLSDLAQVNNTLLGFGMNADQAFGSLQMLGDAAAVTGADLSRVAVAFGQSAAAGRVMTQDLNQFVNNGIPIYQILGEVTGQTTGQIRDMASAGELTFDILQKGFMRATSEGGLFFNGTAKLSQTLGGRLSTLRDNIDILAASFGDVLGEYISPLITGVQNMAQGFAKLDEETKKTIVFFAAAAAAVGPLLLISGTIIPAMITGFTVLTGPVGLITGLIVGLAAGFIYAADNWDAIKERLSDISWWRNAVIEMAQFWADWNIFSKIIKGYNALAKLFNGATINNPFDNMVAGLEKLKVETNEYKNNFGTFTRSLKNGMKKVIGVIDEAVEKTKEAGSEAKKIERISASGGGGTGGGGTKKPPLSIPAFDESLLPKDEELERAEAHVNKLIERFKIAQDNAQAFTNIVGFGIVNAIEGMAAGSENAFQNFIDMLKRLVVRLLAAAAAAFILNKLTGGLLSAMGSTASAPSFQSTFSQLSGGFQLPEFAAGGIVSGPTVGLMGEYRGARQNPEVIAPLSRLKNILAGQGEQNRIVGELRGDTLLLLQERASKNRTRRRGF